mmetsp:Transcript_792/g.2533  ORF Transcript_792/g.2533 Transcript_792/m.2533 type:complete len:579 (-) Transcript_792:36-1772(-)
MSEASEDWNADPPNACSKAFRSVVLICLCCNVVFTPIWLVLIPVVTLVTHEVRTRMSMSLSTLLLELANITLVNMATSLSICVAPLFFIRNHRQNVPELARSAADSVLKNLWGYKGYLGPGWQAGGLLPRPMVLGLGLLLFLTTVVVSEDVRTGDHLNATKWKDGMLCTTMDVFRHHEWNVTEFREEAAKEDFRKEDRFLCSTTREFVPSEYVTETGMIVGGGYAFLSTITFLGSRIGLPHVTTSTPPDDILAVMSMLEVWEQVTVFKPFQYVWKFCAVLHLSYRSWKRVFLMLLYPVMVVLLWLTRFWVIFTLKSTMADFAVCAVMLACVSNVGFIRLCTNMICVTDGLWDDGVDEFIQPVYDGTGSRSARLERRSITLYEWVTEFTPSQMRVMLGLYAMQVAPKEIENAMKGGPTETILAPKASPDAEVGLTSRHDGLPVTVVTDCSVTYHVDVDVVTESGPETVSCRETVELTGGTGCRAVAFDLDTKQVTVQFQVEDLRKGLKDGHKERTPEDMQVKIDQQLLIEAGEDWSKVWDDLQSHFVSFKPTKSAGGSVADGKRRFAPVEANDPLLSRF